MSLENAPDRTLLGAGQFGINANNLGWHRGLLGIAINHLITGKSGRKPTLLDRHAAPEEQRFALC